MNQGSKQTANNSLLVFSNIQKKIRSSYIFIFFIASIFCFLSLFYSLNAPKSYHSELLIKVGTHMEDEAGLLKFIEDPKKLTEELEIKFNLSNSNLRNKLIISRPFPTILSMSYNSISDVTNKEVLMEIYNFINDRHSEIVAKHNQNEINKINQADFYIEKKRLEIQYVKSEFKSKIINKITSVQIAIQEADEVIKATKEAVDREISSIAQLEKNEDLYLQRLAILPSISSVLNGYDSSLIKQQSLKDNLINELSALEDHLSIIDEYRDELSMIMNASKVFTGEFASDIYNNHQEVRYLINEKLIAESKLKYSIDSLVKTQQIDSIKTAEKQKNHNLMAILGIIFGLFFAIILLSFREFLRQFNN